MTFFESEEQIDEIYAKILNCISSINKLPDNNALYDYLFVKTQIKPADLLIVFGTTYGFDEYVEGILKLYNEGFVKTILLTGGKDRTNSHKPESEMMLDCLKSFNLKCDILIEDKSVNTGENLAFSIPILQKHFGKIENIKSIIGLGKDFVARRFLMTMAKYFPTAEKMFYPINVFHCDKSNWYNNNILYQKCLNEWHKIPIYLKKGYIVEI